MSEWTEVCYGRRRRDARSPQTHRIIFQSPDYGQRGSPPRGRRPPSPSTGRRPHSPYRRRLSPQVSRRFYSPRNGQRLPRPPTGPMRYSPDRRPPRAGIRLYSPPRAGRPRAPPGSRRSPSPPRPRHHPRRPDEDRSWDQDRWRFEGRMDRAPPLRYRGDFHNLAQKKRFSKVVDGS